MNTSVPTTSVQPPGDSTAGAAAARVSWREALRTWAYIGVHSFGGPAGQIAVMHKVLVERKRWISEERFLHALNYCMLLPGPEAMQLATYVGWLFNRTWGGILAGTLFVLPGFLSILALSIAYTAFRDVEIVQSLLFGLKAAVLVIVIEALIRISKRALRNGVMYVIAGSSFVAIFFLQVPFPIIIVCAALVGLLGARIAPNFFALSSRHQFGSGELGEEVAYLSETIDASHTLPSARHAVIVMMTWLPLWFAPIIVLGAVLGWDNVLTEEAMFFSKAAVVTFGGAYAVLAYIAQQAVEAYGWLEAGEMLTGLGMAETTPGPLIQVVQFVGYMGGYRDASAGLTLNMHPVLAGTLASLVVTWVTYVPCFFWIFLGAPYMEAMRGRKPLAAALSTITAAVVGVILNLSLWFALHTLFGEVAEWHRQGVRLLVPDPTTIDVPALVIAAIAAIALFRFRVGIMPTLLLAALLGLLWFPLRAALAPS